jgi:hypothetical protein
MNATIEPSGEITTAPVFAWTTNSSPAGGPISSISRPSAGGALAARHHIVPVTTAAARLTAATSHGSSVRSRSGGVVSVGSPETTGRTPDPEA